MGIVKVLTWLSENFTTTAFKGIIRLSENDDFSVRAPNCCCDDKHQKKKNAQLEACQNILQNNHFLDRNEIK